MRMPHGGHQLSWESHGRCPKSRNNHEAFAARWYRGESRHRHGTRRFTQVSAPLCLEVKTYSCFLVSREPTYREDESDYQLQWWWLVTFVSRRSRSRVVCCVMSSVVSGSRGTSAYKAAGSRGFHESDSY